MGYMCHHAIVVTSWDDKAIENAHAKAVELGCGVSAIIASSTNHYRTFLIVPDGSKEGWGESDAGDERRAEFLRWATARRYEDGSSALVWCEVQYGDEGGDNRMLRHDDDERAYWDWGQTADTSEIEPNTRAYEVLRSVSDIQGGNQ